MNPYLLAALFGSGLATGIFVTSNYYDAKAYKVQQDVIERTEEVADAANVTTEAVLKEKVVFQTKWRTKYVDKIRFIERTNTCSLDNDSMLLWQQAISATSQTDSVDPTLPTSDTTY